MDINPITTCLCWRWGVDHSGRCGERGDGFPTHGVASCGLARASDFCPCRENVQWWCVSGVRGSGDLGNALDLGNMEIFQLTWGMPWIWETWKSSNWPGEMLEYMGKGTVVNGWSPRVRGACRRSGGFLTLVKSVNEIFTHGCLEPSQISKRFKKCAPWPKCPLLFHYLNLEIPWLTPTSLKSWILPVYQGTTILDQHLQYKSTEWSKNCFLW